MKISQKQLKLGYIGSVLYTVETVVGRTRVQVPLSQQNNINTKICYICIDEFFDNFDNYNAAMVE